MYYSSPLQKPALVEQLQSPYLRIPGYKYMLTLDQILWVEGEGNYCRIHLVNGKPIMVSQTLKVIMNLVPQLARIHKSFLVNPNHVEGLEFLPNQHKGTIILTNGTCLQVARRRYDEVVKLLLRIPVAS